MEFFKNKVEKDFKIKCFAPANGCTVDIPVETTVDVNMSRNLLKRSFLADDHGEPNKKSKSVVGILVSKNDGVSGALFD
jgi:hypothetical protein